MKHEFYVFIERDMDGFYVGKVPQLRACCAQGRTLDEMMANIREVIGLCLDEDAETCTWSEFVGLQKVEL